jgi:hypothetical protein
MAAVAPSPTRRARPAHTPTRPERGPRRADGARRASARRPGRTLAPTTAALMVLCAVLLAGIVALQTAVIRTNMTLGQLDNTRQTLIGQNAALRTQIADAESEPRIAAAAVRLGMFQPPPQTFGRLVPHG